MIWLTWRQFRSHALIAVGFLAAVTAYLGFLGMQIRDAYNANVNCTGCTAATARSILEGKYGGSLMLCGLLVVAVPGLVGAFWGAPLIAREIETGTHRLVWNQSITRTRWLAVKLAVVVLTALALAGALAVLLTWAASPFDKLIGGRFDPMLFPTRNVVPLGYGLFAVVCGIAVGLLIRRTVPAMAVTLAVFAVLQVLLPSAIRPHLRAPVSTTVTIDANTRISNFSRGESDGRMEVGGYRNVLPGAWILSDHTPLLHADGQAVTSDQIRPCMAGDPRQDMACLAGMQLHFDVQYQPADRYWTFQWLELALYVVLSGLLLGFLFWRITRGLS